MLSYRQACDSVLSIYGTGRPTERHALYKRRHGITTTEARLYSEEEEDGNNLVPDDTAAMGE